MLQPPCPAVQHVGKGQALGRGRTISDRSTNQRCRNRRTRAQGRSLSPRERVGVRGKRVCERESASEASDAWREQSKLSATPLWLHTGCEYCVESGVALRLPPHSIPPLRVVGWWPFQLAVVPTR